MNNTPVSLSVALVVLLGWMGTTLLSGLLLLNTDASVTEQISTGLFWPVFIASLFLLFASRSFQLKNMGWRYPGLFRSILVSWWPLVVIGFFVFLAYQGDLPSDQVILLLFINCMLIGLSEEWMFRGVLFQAFQGVFSMWPTVWFTSIIFGVIHALNIVGTGQVLEGIVQSIAATLTGVLFVAIRIRTGSLYPVIFLHGVVGFRHLATGSVQ